VSRAALLLAAVACGAPGKPSAVHGDWSTPVAPYKITDRVSYVGAKHISAFLITTSAGNILIDSGTTEMEAGIRANIAALGEKLGETKILLCTHAHYDHVGNHAALQRATGAKVMVMRGDAEALASGIDRSPLHGEGWAPVHVDRVLDDHDRVELGDVSLEAIAAPGHTPGCTVWLIDQKIAIYGCARPNDEAELTPALVATTRATFAKLRALSPEIALVTHPDDAAELLHPRPWQALLDEAEADFNARLAARR